MSLSPPQPIAPPRPGSRFAEFLQAYGRREHEAYVQLERYREFAHHLLTELQEYAGIPHLNYVRLEPGAEQQPGDVMNSTGYGDDDWFHVRCRIIFESPNTSLP